MGTGRKAGGGVWRRRARRERVGCAGQRGGVDAGLLMSQHQRAIAVEISVSEVAKPQERDEWGWGEGGRGSKKGSGLEVDAGMGPESRIVVQSVAACSVASRAAHVVKKLSSGREVNIFRVESRRGIQNWGAEDEGRMGRACVNVCLVRCETMCRATARAGPEPFLTCTPAPQTLALAAHATRSFARLVSARALPEELIMRVMCMTQGVVWVGQMLASPPGKSAGSVSESDNEKEKNGGGEKGAARRANRCAHANRNRDKSAPAEPTTSASGAGVQNNNNNNNERVEGKEECKQKQCKTQAAHLAHLLRVHMALLGMGVRELGKVDVYAVPAPAAAANAPQKLSMRRWSLHAPSASVSMPKDSDSSSVCTHPRQAAVAPSVLSRGLVEGGACVCKLVHPGSVQMRAGMGCVGIDKEEAGGVVSSTCALVGEEASTGSRERVTFDTVLLSAVLCFSRPSLCHAMTTKRDGLMASNPLLVAAAKKPKKNVASMSKRKHTEEALSRIFFVPHATAGPSNPPAKKFKADNLSVPQQSTRNASVDSVAKKDVRDMEDKVDCLRRASRTNTTHPSPSSMSFQPSSPAKPLPKLKSGKKKAITIIVNSEVPLLDGTLQAERNKVLRGPTSPPTHGFVISYHAMSGYDCYWMGRTAWTDVICNACTMARLMII
ncbi:hypothetical protein B0H14DRAFT_3607672 [Mycena olivaceomarginata]|nr:hypothetical protein B0H14DRAFT_3607672 [Mycena olivaceomarginata]